MTDYTVGDTFHLAFTTRKSTGLPTVLAGTPVVSAYEDASLTQITAGITLGVDHDGVVGLNMLTIVATGANGYESGKDYNLVITTGTVDSVSVIGEVVGQFTLGRGAAAVDLANVTDGLGALKTLLDAIPTTAMRGTDNAALASVATEARLAELDAANLPADIAAIPLTAMRGTDGVDTAAMRGTDNAALASEVTAARMSELDTAAGKMAFVIDALDTLTKAAGAGDLAAIKVAADAIKVVADKFAFTVANQVDANMQSINDAGVVGDGDATPWDGA